MLLFYGQGCYHKKQALIAHLRSLKNIFIIPSRDNKLITFYIPLHALFLLLYLGFLIGSSNLGSLSITSQVLKYSKNDFQQIFKMVIEARVLTPKTFDKSQKRFFKAKVLDIYWNKSHIDCYNFIE